MYLSSGKLAQRVVKVNRLGYLSSEWLLYADVDKFDKTQAFYDIIFSDRSKAAGQR